MFVQRQGNVCFIIVEVVKFIFKWLGSGLSSLFRALGLIASAIPL